MSLPARDEDEGRLLPPSPEEGSNSDDCCNFWFCLGTSKDEQAKIIQTSCSCNESDGCSHKHRRFHSSYDSFAEYNPHYGQDRASQEDEPVSRNGRIPLGGSPLRGSPYVRTNSRDSPTILKPSIHNGDDEAATV